MDSKGRAYEFAMGFVDSSDRYRQQFIDKWNEVLSNVMVEAEMSSVPRDTSPYRYGKVYSGDRKQILLKDPETHKMVMTYVAKLARILFGDNRHEYVRTRPSGYEDWQKSRTATRYLRYVFGLEGHFRTQIEALWDMVTFGTAVIESPWRYEERPVLARSRSMNMDGTMNDTTEFINYPVYDDVCLRAIDIMDFYPDPSRYRMQDMTGCAKRFRMNAMEAKRMGTYDQTKVEEAISKGTGVAIAKPESFRRGLDQPPNTDAPSEFREMLGYEYWGDVPEDVTLYDVDGKVSPVKRGVITILNTTVVRAHAWPLADYCLPFHTYIINPVNGRFYGISPAEIMRYDQSFADAVKMLLAKAIVRQIHPPIAVDINSEYDQGALKAWKADTIVRVSGGPSAIGTLRYDADIGAGMNLMGMLKQGIQEGSGALGAIQGESGPDREAASVGNQRMQFAMERPELAAMVLENDGLPQLAKSVIRRGQQFEDDDSLARKIGMDPPASLDDLMGDKEVQFFGSRLTLNPQQKLQAIDRIVSLGQVFPAIQMLLPSLEFTKEILGDLLEKPELAALVGQDPNAVMMNLLAAQGLGAGGPAKNGVAQAAEPPGMLPAQAQGY